ncbi:MAG: sodium:solute symporter, partial [Candidatus Eremiobacteraeota bacterium]|nr:sodium:solute symporter [Candidatus Eremiobacteraeota bacterium]
MVAFYAAVVYIGAWAGSRENAGSYEEMMLAGRSMPLWLGVFTMSATWVGGGYINGTAEYTASQGLAWVQAPWGYALSLVLGGVFFARKMRSAGHTTMLDPLAAKYGEKVAAALYIVALSGELFWTGAILAALGTTFGVILGINFTAAIILSALVAVFYTALGGLWAVAGTDVLQLIILLFGLWFVIPFAA